MPQQHTDPAVRSPGAVADASEAAPCSPCGGGAAVAERARVRSEADELLCSGLLAEVTAQRRPQQRKADFGRVFGTGTVAFDTDDCLLDSTASNDVSAVRAAEDIGSVLETAAQISQDLSRMEVWGGASDSARSRFQKSAAKRSAEEARRRAQIELLAASMRAVPRARAPSPSSSSGGSSDC
eukprot:TRINITY_DN20231_c0_g1_i1.p1 TRINITY_DN20231_c0_g1~~TRINITY_DN20231_c0_g1_i1.p1  ORF type:complete len:182 (+),score=47.92 TRINITY_DN20231_c0_g1_i1:61-606(+)